MGAGEYGLQHIDKEWHEIINKAMNIHDNATLKALHSNQERVNSVTRFSKYLFKICNNGLWFITILQYKT
ncbi:hypothetical protein WMZ97_10435 [Lentibacillus sp. N15]|uniref:hypothetical protein n=1 Tax=Lentibacillus songyuanensis TaxID=3136161 RepID=UPI0031C7E718